jgi:hypothetical protein
MASYMSNRARISLILALVVVVSILSAIWAINFEPRTPIWEPRPFPNIPNVTGDLELYYIVSTVTSSLNVTLTSILLATYVSLFRKTKSEFVIGLTLFALIFLLYTLVSNPIVRFVFGYRAFGLGPFVMLPDLFALISLGILLYLSLKY